MKHKSIINHYIYIIGFALSIFAPSAVADNPHFSAVYNNTFTIDPPVEGTTIHDKEIVGKGFSTLFGESSIHFVGVIDISTETGPWPIKGVTTIAVEDEDGSHQLFAETEGLVSPGKDPAGGLVALDYKLIFTHGSGKFSGLKGGSASVLGAADLTTGTASWAVQGKVKY